MTREKLKWGSGLLAIALLFLLSWGLGGHTHAATVEYSSTTSGVTFQSFLNNSVSDGDTVVLTEDVHLTTYVTVSGGKSITITSKLDTDGTPLYTIYGSGSSRMFQVGSTTAGSSGSLTLEDITLDGNGSTGINVSYSGSSLTIGDGATITNCSGGNGPGVNLAVSGTKFVLDGGTITNNTSTTSGGGVYAITGSTVTIKDGTISDNHAATSGGGVYANASDVSIEGGAIFKNTTDGYGAGVCLLGSAGTYTMSGGIIGSTDTTMIPGNTAGTNGGGLYLGA
ncbi:MAG: hypothetical protein LUG13_04980, partial [Oscillospiraceae bacterium]|nr:hypothetical protein [Oscillospiraceae bacterium]